MILGNIVSNITISNIENFKHYSFDDIINDLSLPTLYIGFTETKKLFGEDINPVDRELSKLIFWSFSRNENNKIMVNDVFKFKIYCHYYLINNLKYHFINPFDNRKKLLNVISHIKKSYNSKIVEFENKMIYINIDNNIFGLDLNFIEYLGFDINKFKIKLHNLSSKYCFSNDLNDDIKLFNEIIEDNRYSCFFL